MSARRNLVDAVHVLMAMGARPFLVDGTLLGAIREGAFIAHDKDVDLGLFIEEYHPSLTERMVQAGFAVHRVYGTRERGWQFSFKRDGVKVDIFCYYLDAQDRRFHAAWLDGVPIRYSYPFFILADLLFEGHRFLVPALPQRFLETKYGPGWRTPVKDWDWAWGPHNAEPWVAV